MRARLRRRRAVASENAGDAAHVEHPPGAGRSLPPPCAGKADVLSVPEAAAVSAVGAPHDAPSDPLRTARALRAQAIAALGAALGSDASVPYALLDFPRYANVGDSAIWLGTRAALDALGFPPPAYTCDERTFDARALERRVGRGPILLLGGGNFGDLHRKHQRLREAVAVAFPDNDVVQPPETLHFRSPAAREQARRVLGAHRRLRVLVRDEASLAEATHDLGLDARLAPDLAFGFTPPPRAPTAPPLLLWLSRADAWRRFEPPASVPGLEVSDWPPDGNPWLRRKMRALVAAHRGALRACCPCARPSRARTTRSPAGASTARSHGCRARPSS